jgi:hypothetical protein
LIVIVTESIRCLLMLVVAWLCAIGADISWIIALTLLAAAAGTFSMPALVSLAPELASDDDELGLSNAIRATLDSVAGVVGPALAGVLIVTGGLPLAFALNGVSFAVVVGALLVWRPSPGRQTSPVDERTTGHGQDDPFMWSALLRRIAGALVLDGAISFGSAAIGVLAVLIAVEWLKAGESFTGVLNAGAGIGGIAGGIAAGVVINRDTRAGLTLGVIAFTGAMLVMGSAAAPLLAVAAMATAVGALVLLDTLNMTKVQRLMSVGETGRAIGLLHSLAALWMMAGVLVPTACLALIGIQAAILVPAVVMLGLGAVSLVTSVGGPSEAVDPIGTAAAPTASAATAA